MWGIMNKETIMDIINGKKTYMICITSLIALAVAWANHQVTDQAAIEQAVGLLIAMTIRHGVDNSVTAAIQNNTATVAPTNVVTTPEAPKAKNVANDGIKITIK
jgi:high-affinity nickel permease